MSLFALEIPDDEQEQVRWLERHLVGVHLADLVAELEAVHGPTRAAFDDVVEPHLARILETGLAGLPRSLVRDLLTNPRLLVELQERVCVDGGDHWSRLAPAPDRARLRLRAAIGRRRRRTFAALAAAAVVLLSLFVWRTLAPAPDEGWGWTRTGVVGVEMPRGDYLRALAAAAQEWFDARPRARADVARRLAEFRRGCTELIRAAHPALPEADRRWLVERCRAWAARLDEHREALEGGRGTLAVRADADATIERLVAALRARAA